MGWTYPRRREVQILLVDFYIARTNTLYLNTYSLLRQFLF